MKLKYQRNTQLKYQKKSPERINNKTDLFSLIGIKFKKEIMKIMKELRRSIEM